MSHPTDPVTDDQARPDGPDRPSFLGGAKRILAHQWRRDKWFLVGILGFMLTVLVWVIELPFFLEGGLDNLFKVAFYHLWMLGWLLTVTWFTRTVSLRKLVTYWFVGVFPVVTATMIVGKPLLGLLGSGPLTVAFLLPIVEETAKAIPVVLFFALAARRNRWQPSIADGLLLGFAVGAGFAFHEELLYGRSVAIGLGPGFWNFFFPAVGHVGGGLFGGPSRWVLTHAGWTMLVGLGVGVFFVFRHRWYLAWPFPLGAFALATIDHMGVNYHGWGSGILDLFLLSGMLPMIVLVIGMLLILPFELGLLWWTARRFRETYPRIPLRAVEDVFDRPLGSYYLAAAQAMRYYVRYRRAGLLAMRRWRVRGRIPPAGEGMMEDLYDMSVAAGANVPDAADDAGSEAAAGD